MKNRMNVPKTYEPVLPGKVDAHLEKKESQATQDSLLTQTAIAVGNVIAMLQDSPNTNIFGLEINRFQNHFDVKDLTPEELRHLKAACVNHLSHLIPGIETESYD